jgi:hypothetical protein
MLQSEGIQSMFNFEPTYWNTRTLGKLPRWRLASIGQTLVRACQARQWNAFWRDWIDAVDENRRGNARPWATSPEPLDLRPIDIGGIGT